MNLVTDALFSCHQIVLVVNFKITKKENFASCYLEEGHQGGIMAVGETDHQEVTRQESNASSEDSRMRLDSESSTDDGQFNCLEPLGFDDLRKYADLSAR